MNEEWFCDGFYWRKHSPPWEVETYGEAVNGKGDLIFNTCVKILEDNDTSEWAYTALVNCADLLMARKRWPDRMNQECDAKNRIQRWWSERMSNLDKWLFADMATTTEKHRPQGDMTRDPYIAYYTLCVKFGLKAHIEVATMPLYLYRHEVWRWRRRLIKDNSPDYVKRLRYLRAKAITLNYEKWKQNQQVNGQEKNLNLCR